MRDEITVCIRKRENFIIIIFCVVRFCSNGRLSPEPKNANSLFRASKHHFESNASAELLVGFETEKEKTYQMEFLLDS